MAINRAGQEWAEDSPHGMDCAMRITSAAECTCGKLDALAEHAEKSLWLAVHHHRHGCDTFFIRAEQEPTEDQWIETCDIDFEPEREEYIDVFHVSNDQIREL